MAAPVRLRVLILEDRIADAELVLDELAQAGFAPDWQGVYSEVYFLACLDPSFQIILADYNMPQFNAIRALELLQQRELDIPFILVSGSIGEDLAVRAMKQGATDYLLKDRLGRLGEAVSHALRQKVAQTALRQSEASFSKIFHVSPVGIVISDIESGRVLDVNESFLSMIGYDRDDIVGHAPVEFGMQLSLANQYVYSKSFSQSTTIRTSEEEFSTKSGELRQALISAEAIELANKTCVLSFIYDITERKRAEAEMMQAELLRIELEKEKELLDLKERFISTVTHEFRTPLTVILTAAGLLDQYFDRLTPAKRREHLDNIQGQVQFMNELLNDVLNLRKARLGKLDFNPKPVDIHQFCTGIFEQLQIVDAGAHQFVFTDRKFTGEVYIDERIMQHVLVNLLSNALKYSPQGGEIGFDLSSEDGALVFRISDQGIGIPVDDQKRLYEPFHRAKNTGEIQGTGLGLAIVKSNVEVHCGTITCESEPNKGTTFTVRIPLERPTARMG